MSLYSLFPENLVDESRISSKKDFYGSKNHRTAEGNYKVVDNSLWIHHYEQHLSLYMESLHPSLNSAALLWDYNTHSFKCDLKCSLPFTCHPAVCSQLLAPSSLPLMLRGPLWAPASPTPTSCSLRPTRRPAAPCSTCCTATERSMTSASPCRWATNWATHCPSMLTGSKVTEVPELWSSTSWAIT